MLKFSEWMKMKKSSFKQSKPKGVRDLEDDLSKDYKGHLERNGTIEPFEIKKEGRGWLDYGKSPDYTFKNGDRVQPSTREFKTGEVVSCVPGNGTYPYGLYYVIWDGETEESGPYQPEELQHA